MRINQTILISFAAHLFVLGSAAYYLKVNMNSLSAGQGCGTMDLTLVASPRIKPAQKELISIPIQPADSETTLTKNDTPESSFDPSAENGNGNDTVNYQEEGGGAYNEYFANVREKIIRSKYYPKNALSHNCEGKIIVSFDIERTGALRAVRVVSPSGYAPLNDAAIATIHKSAPFKPFPGSLKDNQLTLQITLEYKLPKLAQAF